MDFRVNFDDMCCENVAAFCNEFGNILSNGDEAVSRWATLGESSGGVTLRDKHAVCGAQRGDTLAVEVDVAYSACGVGVLNFNVFRKQLVANAFSVLVVSYASDAIKRVFHACSP